MNNRTIRLSVGALAVGAIALLAQNGQSQTVYNNTTTFTGDFNYGNNQAGNQVILAGSVNGDDVTSFAFQYDFLNSSGGTTGTPVGGETATLTFYQNYGPSSATKVSGYTVPQTPVLFSSTPVSIAANYTSGSTITFTTANGGLTGGGIDVPQNFTWTVTFAGIGASEQAGLALYGSGPSVGQNYSDAWYGAAGTSPTWALDVASGSNPALTFGATIAAVPEPSSLGLFAMGGLGLLASGWRKLRR
jgi:hypothetical protein